jgi:hypothetical protein
MDQAPEFSRRVPVDHVTERGRVQDIVADAAERAALAARFGLIAVDRLEARVTLTRAGLSYRLEADWRADVVQTCTVTLEPVPAHLSDRLAERYGLAEQGPELDLDPELDTAEPIEEGVIDIGEAVAQALSLSLDPYPRKPGATLEIPGGAGQGGGAFAELARLKGKA